MDGIQTVGESLNSQFQYDRGVRSLTSTDLSSAQVCLICLDTHKRPYLLSKYNLEGEYRRLTGLEYCELGLAPALCMECVKRLFNYRRFRDKSIKAHSLLLDLIKKRKSLSLYNIKMIDRTDNHLTSTITRKLFEANHCDLYIKDEKEENVEEKVSLVGIEHTTDKTDIKHETDDIVCVIETKGENINEAEQNHESNTTDVDLINDTELNNQYDIEFVNNDSNNDDEFLNNDDTDNSDSDEEFLYKLNVNKEIGNHNKKAAANEDNSIENSNIESNKGQENEVKARNVKPKSARKSVKAKMGKRKPASIEGIKLFKITKLSYEEQLAELEERKSSTNYENSIYTCDTCYKGYSDKNAYNRHLLRHTSNYGEIECSICKLHFKGRHRLNQHVVQYHSIRYSCTACQFVTKHKQTARLHENWHKGIKYKCSHCDKQFIRVSTYLTHLRLKHPSDLVCTLCGCSFISQKGIHQHMYLKHRLESTENLSGPTCELCDVRFATSAAYNKHLKVSPKHTGDDKRSAQPTPEYEQRSYVKRSGSPAKAKPSMEEGEPVTCEQCGIKLKDFRLYSYHFRRTHPDKNRTLYAPTTTPCLCEQCGKVFQNPTHLRNHMASHSGQRQFRCETCDKRFPTQTHLLSHMVVHSDTRQSHECPICGKGFAYKSNRSRHLLSHSGIHNKSYKCEVCDKGFNTPSERALHVAHVHLKKPWPKRNRGPRAKGRHPRPGKGATVIQGESET